MVYDLYKLFLAGFSSAKIRLKKCSAGKLGEMDIMMPSKTAYMYHLVKYVSRL